MYFTQTTKCICCFMVLQSLGYLDSVQSVSVATSSQQPQKPKTVEAQAKFFQYMHAPTHEDYDHGHRQGNEKHFTERHDRSRPSDGAYSAKVRWGDKQGGYGEHYWDLNHAGGANNNDNDDGSYDPHTEDENYDQNKDLFEEPSEPIPSYKSDGSTDRLDTSQYDELGRSKRAHPRVKSRKQHYNEETPYPEQKTRRNKPKQYPHEELHADNTEEIRVRVTDDYEEDEQSVSEEIEEEEPVTRKPVRKTKKIRKKEIIEALPEKEPEALPEPEQPKLGAQQFPPAAYTTPQQYVTRTLPEVTKDYMPYENGAGVRQHFQTENLTPAVPRLFLEPTTGHVIDRATGQAYVLQPILNRPYQ